MSRFPLSPNSLQETRLFLPAWWVNSYEASWAQDQNHIQQQVFTQGILPVFSAFQINLLALLISDLQKKILSKHPHSEPNISLEFSRFLHIAGHCAEAQKKLLLQLFASLKDLRVLSYKEDRPVFTSLFTEEGWQQSGNEVTLTLRAHNFADELLLGYVSAYEELGRVLKKTEPLITPILKNNPPLCLWKAIWLDLKGSEQAVFLRMEKSKQWEDSATLNLQGIYGKPSDTLLSHLKGGKLRSFPKPISSAAPWSESLKAMQRISLKLLNHGLISPCREKTYLAFDKKSKEQGLWIWKDSPQSGLHEDIQQHQQRCHRWFFDKCLQDSTSSWMGPICVGLSEKQVAWLMQKAGESLSKDEQGVLSKDCFQIDGNKLIPGFALFIEWIARSHPESKWPLPYDFKNYNFLQGFDHHSSKKASDFVEQYQIFIRTIKEDGDFTHSLEKTPYATLASQATQSSSIFSKFIADFQDQPQYRGKNTTPSIRQDKHEKLSPSFSQTTQKRLDQLRNRSKETYSDLMKSYIDSLDDSSRRMILDVQKHMKPEMFEEHLRVRLLSFMTDNPSVWQKFELKTAVH